MPEPRTKPRAIGQGPPPLWPDWLPNPQAPSLSVVGPPRVTVSNVLKGPTRLRVDARTAPMEFGFAVWFTPAQMEQFELWYRRVVEEHDGEFYARWIGGNRVVAFSDAYEYEALGSGYVLQGTLVRTRVDDTACDEYLVAFFGAIYRDDGVATDVYQADLDATDIYVDDYDLRLIAKREC